MSGAIAATVRPATLADARPIAEVHVEGWRWGYRELLPPDVLDALSIEGREQTWIEFLTERDPNRAACFVAEDARGRVVGFVACGPAEDHFAAPPDGAAEVYALYLRDGVQGAGVGRVLFTRAVEAMRSSGFPTAVLWVFDANARARRFYEAAGWVPDGAGSLHRFQGGERPIMRYAADVSGVSTPR